ncbi:hypothetical protein WBP06_09355 [Novosphingobium sp. BL-8H]|uniref:hypothetical protein n=1 Tax=Novosphingobium sp. BL-8H TaxID=3127640 RepID=UPI0037569562
MLRLFRRAPAPAVAAEPENPGRALAQIKADKARERHRALHDQLRADLLAKGHARMTPYKWGES